MFTAKLSRVHLAGSFSPLAAFFPQKNTQRVHEISGKNCEVNSIHLTSAFFKEIKGDTESPDFPV